jgi:hypothetical protein
MGLETVVQQRHCLRGVLVQPLIVQRAQVDLAQRGDARGQLGPPLRIPALQQPAGLVGVNRGRRVPDPSAQPRHHPHQQRQQPAGRWWPVPAAQRHQPGVPPAPEILELQALGQCPELGERLPDGPVAGLRQHRQQHRRQGLHDQGPVCWVVVVTSRPEASVKTWRIAGLRLPGATYTYSDLRR